jgi:Leucine-rich repeat (LRR) protein
MSENLLAWLPPEVGLLTSLRELNVSINKLKKLPDEIGLLTNLVELKVYVIYAEVDDLLDIRE